MRSQPPHRLADRELASGGTRHIFPGGELHLTESIASDDTAYHARGYVHFESASTALLGSFVRIRSLATGLTEEAFLDDQGSFAQEMELDPKTNNSLELSLCDGLGRELARLVVEVRRADEDQAGKQNHHTAPSRQTSRSPILDPPWPRFVQLVERCLNLAGEVAEKTSRSSDEFCEHIRVQERYAEQAYEARDQNLYQECNDNLEKYRGYLMRLLGDTLPRPPRPSRPPEEEARMEVERFRAYLSSVWKQVREKQRSELEAHLSEVAGQARGLSQRARSDPRSVLREINRLGSEVEKVAELLHSQRR